MNNAIRGTVCVCVRVCLHACISTVWLQNMYIWMARIQEITHSLCILISGLWDKYTLTSDVSTLKSQRYVAAVFKDGNSALFHSHHVINNLFVELKCIIVTSDELHLSPLCGLIQLRPGMGYLDKVDTGTKKSNLFGTSNDGDTTESEGEEAKPVTVRFAKRESLAKAQKPGVHRRQNYEEVVEEQLSAEKWIDVEYHGVESEEAIEVSTCITIVIGWSK